MERKRYVVMGAGQVGLQLAESLSREGHNVTVIERNSDTGQRIDEELDVQVIIGNGAEVQVLESARVEGCDLFMAVSSGEEANLAASLLAKRLGARRTAVRVETAAHEATHRKLYEEVFDVDILLSTQLLTSTRVLNHIRGHNTMAVEYFAGGKVELRKISLDESSLLTEKPLRDVSLPKGSLVVAFYRGEELIIPSGDDRAEPGDEALILGETEVITDFERMVSNRKDKRQRVFIAGGGPVTELVALSLTRMASVKIIEKERERARVLAATFPRHEVLLGDTTDLGLLKAERLDRADHFIALTGHDETNLMACLLAQELGVPNVMALLDRSETSDLWRRLGLVHVFSPRALANQRIHEYIDNGYSANIVSLSHGTAQVMERWLYKASPAAGVTLAEMTPPRGMRVGVVVRGKKVFVPQGKDRLEVGDRVILFVHESERGTVQLLFPGRPDREGG